MSIASRPGIVSGQAGICQIQKAPGILISPEGHVEEVATEDSVEKRMSMWLKSKVRLLLWV